jgi:hypothetical protein
MDRRPSCLLMHGRQSEPTLFRRTTLADLIWKRQLLDRAVRSVETRNAAVPKDGANGTAGEAFEGVVNVSPLPRPRLRGTTLNGWRCWLSLTTPSLDHDVWRLALHQFPNCFRSLDLSWFDDIVGTKGLQTCEMFRADVEGNARRAHSLCQLGIKESHGDLPDNSNRFVARVIKTTKRAKGGTCAARNCRICGKAQILW